MEEKVEKLEEEALIREESASDAKLSLTSRDKKEEEADSSSYFQSKEEISHFRFPIDKNRLVPPYSRLLKPREEIETITAGLKSSQPQLPLFAPHCLIRTNLSGERVGQRPVGVVPPSGMKEQEMEPIVRGSPYEMFVKDEDLVLSARLINKRKPHACQECGRSFAQSKDLIRHIRTHSGEKPFECTQCRRTFARHDYLIKHFRIHSGEKPYECGHCGKKFAQRGSLVSHTRVHSELKPPIFKCNQCGKKFTQYESLARHASMHVANSSVEEQGGMSPTSKKSVQDTLLNSMWSAPPNDKGYKCNQCNKKFNQYTLYVNHCWVHNMEKSNS